MTLSRLHVDGNITSRKLHHILQAAVAWTDLHLHDFEIDGRTYAVGDTDNMLDLLAEDPEMLDDPQGAVIPDCIPGTPVPLSI
ncbi:plasmid pRiA4b ORF-3 family protein (plasmid) [Burkholderia sp. M6-3]